MNVTCPNCATIFRVDPAKVPESGVRARCNVCSAVFAVRHEASPSPLPIPEPARAEPARAQAVAPPPPPAPPPQPAPPVSAPPAMAPPVPARPAMSPAAPAAPPRPAAPPSRPFAPAAAAPAPPPAPAPAPPPQAQAPAPVTPARPATPGRAVNPFLSQDPALKARRLARALISDMVVYHPGKRQDGLQNGTLKELFEDEIRKSWEEYADQVGRQVADSTPYFKEALNEILAGGRQIF